MYHMYFFVKYIFFANKDMSVNTEIIERCYFIFIKKYLQYNISFQAWGSKRSLKTFSFKTKKVTSSKTKQEAR